MEKPREKTSFSFSTMLKVLVFSLPVIVATEVVGSRNHVVIAACWVAGALLQTLIPPARKGLVPILTLALLVGIAYVTCGGAHDLRQTAPQTHGANHVTPSYRAVETGRSNEPSQQQVALEAHCEEEAKVAFGSYLTSGPRLTRVVGMAIKPWNYASTLQACRQVNGLGGFPASWMAR